MRAELGPEVLNTAFERGINSVMAFFFFFPIKKMDLLPALNISSSVHIQLYSVCRCEG